MAYNYNKLFYNDVVIQKHENEFNKILERIDYSDFNNYVHFGMAYYLLTATFNNIIKTYPINLSVTSTTNANYIEKYEQYIEDSDQLTKYLVEQFPTKIVITAHDGITGSYSNIQRNLYYQLQNQTDLDFVSDYLLEAQSYDAGNHFNLTKLIPQFLILLDESEILQKFLHTLGQSLDVDYNSISQLQKQFHVNYSDKNKYSKGIEIYLAKLLGFNLINSQFERTLSQYLQRDNSQRSFSEINEQIWNRILNNLMYLFKTKGTKESINALLNCYGIYNDLIRIQEYGETTKPITGSMEAGTYSITSILHGKYVDNDKVKIGVKPEYVKNIPNLSISFDPIDELDRDIINSFSTSAIDISISQAIGYPDIYYYDNRLKYSRLSTLSQQYFATRSFDLSKFIDFVEDFDKGIMQSIQQLIPARTKLQNNGITIKEHILEKERLTDGKILDYTDYLKNTVIDYGSISSLYYGVQTTVNKSVLPTATYNEISGQTPRLLTLSSNYNSLSSSYHFVLSKYLYSLSSNVVSTTAYDNLLYNNIDNTFYNSVNQFSYQDKYYIEKRVLQNNIDDSLKLRLSLISSFLITSLNTSATSNCVININLDNKPLEFIKVKITVPISSGGDRLLDVSKQSTWTDIFGSLDCLDSSISGNTKLNIFEFYTDINGLIQLKFTNKNFRTGVVTVFFEDEYSIIKTRVDISLTGSGDTGTFQYTDLDIKPA